MVRKLIKTIFARRSIRKYTADPVEENDIKTILEAAMAAPSASNRKPQHFIVVTNRGILEKLARAHPYGKMLFKAPLCIAVCGDITISSRYWVQDCSAATENLLLAATALGLGAVWLGVHPREERINRIKKILKIPGNIIPLNLISIGHPAEKKEPRTQYDEHRVHREQWYPLRKAVRGYTNSKEKHQNAIIQMIFEHALLRHRPMNVGCRKLRI